MISSTNLEKCHDSIRFTIADKDGTLRFTRFEITDEESCYNVQNKLQSYLLNRPLRDIDIGAIRHVLSDGHEDCVRAIADIKEWFCPKIKTDNL